MILAVAYTQRSWPLTLGSYIVVRSNVRLVSIPIRAFPQYTATEYWDSVRSWYQASMQQELEHKARDTLCRYSFSSSPSHPHTGAISIHSLHSLCAQKAQTMLELCTIRRYSSPTCSSHLNVRVVPCTEPYECHSDSAVQHNLHKAEKLRAAVYAGSSATQASAHGRQQQLHGHRALRATVHCFCVSSNGA